MVANTIADQQRDFAVSQQESRAQFRAHLMMILAVFLVFFTESTFRARKFQVNIALDWQIMLQVGVWGLCGIAAVCLGGLKIENYRKPTVLLSLLLVLWMLVSVTYSPVPLESMVSALGYLIFLLFAVAMSRNCTERQCMTALAFGISLDVLSAPILFLAQLEPGVEEAVGSTGAGRIHGLLPHPARLGTDAALLVLIAVVLSLEAPRRFLWRLLALASAGVMILSTAKTAILALVLSGLLVWWRRNRVLTALTPVYVLALLGLAILVGLVGVNALLPNELLTLISRSGRAADALTFTGRTEIWDFAMDKWARSPLLGYGMNSGRYTIFGVFSGWSVFHAHNAFLNCLLYLGLIGFLLFMTVVFLRTMEFLSGRGLFQDWVFLFVLALGLGEQGAMSDKPSLPVLVWFLAMVTFSRQQDASSYQRTIKPERL